MRRAPRGRCRSSLCSCAARTPPGSRRRSGRLSLRSRTARSRSTAAAKSQLSSGCAPRARCQDACSFSGRSACARRRAGPDLRPPRPPAAHPAAVLFLMQAVFGTLPDDAAQAAPALPPPPAPAARCALSPRTPRADPAVLRAEPRTCAVVLGAASLWAPRRAPGWPALTGTPPSQQNGARVVHDRAQLRCRRRPHSRVGAACRRPAARCGARGAAVVARPGGGDHCARGGGRVSPGGGGRAPAPTLRCPRRPGAGAR